MHFLYQDKSYTSAQICALGNDAPWFKEIQKFLANWNNPEESIGVMTSGSTGQPKRISLSKKNVRKSADLTIQYFGLQPKMKALLCLPAQYIAGKLMIVRAIQADMDIILVEPSSNPLQGVIEKIDFVAMTPFQMSNVLNRQPEKLNLVGKILLGGGMVSEMLKSKIQDITAQCYLGFGMTETITHMAIQPLNFEAESDTFTIMKGFSISQDERSCLIIEADHIYQKKVITNDVVEIIDEQRFRWIGRWDNVINTGGIKVFPEEVESKIKTIIDHPFFIFGKPEDELGETVVLLIESPRFDSQKYENLEAVLRKTLKKYEMPRSIIFLDCFDYTSTGKIRRKHTFRQYLKHVRNFQ